MKSGETDVPMWQPEQEALKVAVAEAHQAVPDTHLRRVGKSALIGDPLNAGPRLVTEGPRIDAHTTTPDGREEVHVFVRERGSTGDIEGSGEISRQGDDGEWTHTEIGTEDAQRRATEIARKIAQQARARQAAQPDQRIPA
jgi:hypothetical protein